MPRASARASRWHASSTTFGPLGRLAWTAAVVTGLTWGFFHLFVVGWLCLVVIGVVILRDVWRPARIVPERPEPRTPGLAAASPPDGDQPPVVVLIRPWAAAAVAALVIFLMGGETTKIAVIMLTTLVGTFTFFRGFVR